MPSWDWAERWRVPSRPPPSWLASQEWSRSFADLVKATDQRLQTCLRLWDERLRPIGGEPAREDWSAFRPLRLSREEDWSDWLGHLLSEDRSSRFVRALLGGPPDRLDWTVESVGREVAASDYRADLVVRFAKDSSWAHIEVKVGDLAMDKTLDTTDALRQVERGSLHGEFLLLPVEHVAYWRERAAQLGPRADAVTVITWTDVALALRRALLDADQDIRWRVFAAAFLGAIEQRLLRFPIAGPSHRARTIDLERIRMMEEALEDPR